MQLNNAVITVGFSIIIIDFLKKKSQMQKEVGNVWPGLIMP